MTLHSFTLAEDHADFLFLIHRMISRSFPQANIASFSNAEDALHHILDVGTDILLTNHGMGAMSGAELVRELRQRGSGSLSL
jgi:DNA-binding NarL/FixJ family response regulator